MLLYISRELERVPRALILAVLKEGNKKPPLVFDDRSNTAEPLGETPEELMAILPLCP